MAQVTTLGFALSTYILADGGAMLEALQEGDTSPINTALPIAGTIAALQLVHEASHLVAARVHGLKTGIT